MSLISLERRRARLSNCIGLDRWLMSVLADFGQHDRLSHALPLDTGKVSPQWGRYFG